MPNPFDILNRPKPGKIVNPFGKKFTITISANLETGQTEMATNINFPIPSVISILLHCADTLVKQWAAQDGMIIGKNNNLESTEKAAETDGEKTDQNDHN